MCISRCTFPLSVFIGVGLLALFLVVMPVKADTTDVIVVTVSEFKAAPGKTVKVPIYIRGADQISVTHLTLNIVYDRTIVRFEELVTDDSFLWNASGIYDHELRKSKVSADFENPIFTRDYGILLFMVVTVIGDKGSTGMIELESFQFSELTDAEIITIGSLFRVLPVAIYRSDRDLLEVVSFEPFLSFELEVNGEIDLGSFQAQASGWEISQNGNTIVGLSPTTDGASSISFPVEEDVDFTIFSLKLDDEDPVILKKRQLLLPFISN